MLTRSHAARQHNAMGLLDIGTSKTACIIVAPSEAKAGGLWRQEPVRILGHGCKPSRGIKAGVIIDHDGVEQAIRSAMTQAEQMAGMTISDVLVAVTCGRLQSRTVAADVRLEGKRVSDSHLQGLAAAGRADAERDGCKLLHINPVRYTVDGTAVASHPVGSSGTHLGAELHAVTIDDAPLRSLVNVAERAGLDLAGVVPAPYSSGLAATTDEERNRGVLCIDMGAGATTLSVFFGGKLHVVDGVAVGGQHVTFDIARSLSTPFDQAERIKTLYGTLEGTASDDQGMVAYTLAGEEEPALHQTTKARIQGIISGRMADLLTHIAERIERSGAARLALNAIVLTGGASQLPGLARTAETIFDRPVRIARLQPKPGLSPDWCSPAYSTAVGLTEIVSDPSAGIRTKPGSSAPQQAGYLERVGQWLRRGS